MTQQSGRRVLVVSFIENPYDFISELTGNNNYTFHRSPDLKRLIVMENEPYRYDSVLYQFTVLSPLGNIDLASLSKSKSSKIFKELDSLKYSNIALILFLVFKDEDTWSAYHNIYGIIQGVYDDKIPLLFIVSDCTNEINAQCCKSHNRSLLANSNISVNVVCGPLKQEKSDLWKTIAKCSLDTERYAKFGKNSDGTLDQLSLVPKVSKLKDTASDTNYVASTGSTGVSKEHRRIIIFGYPRNYIRSFVSGLTSQHGHSNDNVKYTSPDMQVTELWMPDGNIYSFIEIHQVPKQTPNAMQREKYSQFLKNLKDYVEAGIHLILFVTHNSRLDPPIIVDLQNFISITSAKEVAVVCVVIGCDSKGIENWQSTNLPMLEWYKINLREIVSLPARSLDSKSIETLWKIIKEYSITSNTIRDDGCNTSLNLAEASPSHTAPSLPKKWLSLIGRSKSLHTCPDDKDIDLGIRNNNFEVTHHGSTPALDNDIVSHFFNNQNTDVKILIGNCQRYFRENSPNNCVLIMTGSLNPIHRGHISNLELVKQYLEKSIERWNVLAGYLSPTHDSYVKGKLGKATIPGRQRCQLCELAIQEHESETGSIHWIAVSKAESEYYHGFVDFPQVTKTLSQFLNSSLYGTGKLFKQPLTVIYVCGLDHFNKCPDVARLARNNFIKCAVVYRQGCDDRQIRATNKSSNIIYVPLDDKSSQLSDISSTEIRTRLKNPKNDLHSLTYDCVIRYLRSISYGQ